MKTSITTKPTLQIALVESDPLRLVGFRALLESESDFELISASLAEIAIQANIDVALLGDRPGQNLLDTISSLTLMRPKLVIVVIGPAMDDKSILKVIVSGAKGYVFEGASACEFAKAIRSVSRGSVWVSRPVLSMFVEWATSPRKRTLFGAHAITDREKEVLTLLVSGLTNKQIGAPLGIGARTVKAHISKIRRKLGLHNRIELSMHAVTHSLVTSPAN